MLKTRLPRQSCRSTCALLILKLCPSQMAPLKMVHIGGSRGCHGRALSVQFLSFSCYFRQNLGEQECILVGCVPSAAVVVCWGGGCVCSEGYLPRGGVCLRACVLKVAEFPKLALILGILLSLLI